MAEESARRATEHVAAVEKIALRMDVGSVAPRGCHHLAMDLFVRKGGASGNPLLWVCVPGGGINRKYFDLEVTGRGTTFSMAHALAERGDLVVTIDPPGVGESDEPDDGYSLSPSVVSDVLAAAIETFRNDIGRGDGSASATIGSVKPRAVVGLGHSAGALIVACQQARHLSYDMLALLGFSASGLPQVLNEEELSYVDRPVELAQSLARLAKARFGDPLPDWSNRSSGEFGPIDLETAVNVALAAASARLLALVGMTAIVPGSVQPELNQLRVPIFVGLGEHDLAGSMEVIPAQLPECTDLTLFLLKGAGHNHNVASNRQSLWSRVLNWADSVATA